MADKKPTAYLVAKVRVPLYEQDKIKGTREERHTFRYTGTIVVSATATKGPEPRDCEVVSYYVENV